MFFGAIGLILISFTDPSANRWADVVELNPIRWSALLYLSLVCSVMGYFVYNFAQRKSPLHMRHSTVTSSPSLRYRSGSQSWVNSYRGQRYRGAVLIGFAAAIMGWVNR